MRPNVLISLQNQILLSDGAVGTELQRMGLEPGGCSEIWNIEHPDKVRSLHRAYLEAGAQLLTTNSFRGNRFALSHYRLESRVQELNYAAAVLAREVAGDRAWVMGSLGPFGGILDPLGETSEKEAYAWFLEQSRSLLAGGVDIILVETMSAVEEVMLAIRAAREAGAPIVFSTMTFARTNDSYRTLRGVTPRQAVEAMENAGADVVGCNCGTELEMEDHEKIVEIFCSFTRNPILVQPNAGQPELVGSGIRYRRTPEAMAHRVFDLVHAGANIVGGCCGTTPEHIRKMGERLRSVSKS